MPTVHADVERRLILDVLLALGADEGKAIVQADWLLEGDLRGHPSHGLHRLSVIAGRIRAGLTDPRAEPSRSWSGGSALIVDGRRGMGPYVGMRTVETLLPARALDRGCRRRGPQCQPPRAPGALRRALRRNRG